jgi:hypothetical protein
VLFSKCNYNDEVQKDEMRRVCSTNGERRNACRILQENPKVMRMLRRT